MLENAAARLSGQQNRESRLSAPGKPMDNFITQALAPSPSYDEMVGRLPPSPASGMPSRVTFVPLLTGYLLRLHFFLLALFSRPSPQYALPSRVISDNLTSYYRSRSAFSLAMSPKTRPQS